MEYVSIQSHGCWAFPSFPCCLNNLWERSLFDEAVCLYAETAG